MNQLMNQLLQWLRAAAESDDWDDCPVAAARHKQAADEIERLQKSVDRLTADYAKLHGCVQAYIEAPGQIRGEAFRDLAGTMEHLSGRDDAQGWAACHRRLEAEIERLQAERPTIVSWMLNEFDVGYHACITGDCPHERQSECVAALLEAIEAARTEAMCRCAELAASRPDPGLQAQAGLHLKGCPMGKVTK